MAPTCIDLFAGCGGMSLGLHHAGFQGILAVEAHPDAFASYRHNLIDTGRSGHDWPKWLPLGPTNIVDLSTTYANGLASLSGQVDLIAGGPPCQGFSMNGRRNPDDPRSRMVEAYLEIVDIVRPRLVLLENVRGFTSMPHAQGGTYAEAVKARLEELGYDCWTDVLLASDWGAPQRRPRFICIAAQKGMLPGVNPLERLRTSRREFLTARGLWPSPTTAAHALSDLSYKDGTVPDPDWGSRGFSAVERAETGDFSAYQLLMRKDSVGQPTDRRVARHTEQVTRRMSEILNSCELGRSISPENRKRLGIGKRSTTPLSPDLPSPTVTTLPDDMIHYCEPRTMSVRELARLQSFPDWFEFQGPYTTGGDRRKDGCPRYTQVGNAVPPILAEAIGEILLELLAEHDHSHTANEVKLPLKLLSVSGEVVNSHGITRRSHDLPTVLTSGL